MCFVISSWERIIVRHIFAYDPILVTYLLVCFSSVIFLSYIGQYFNTH